MGSLLLLRHGQASAQAQDYDQLSPLGEEQSRRLGALWARSSVRIDRLFHGPRRRQRGTANLVFEALQAAGHPPRELTELADLDEMRIEGLLGATSALREQVPGLAALFEALARTEDPVEHSRAFMRVGAQVIRLWMQGRLEAPDVETFAAFRARVERVLLRARHGAGKGARVVCATSAGVIATAAHLQLGLDADHTCDLLLRIRNSSYAELLFSGERLTWTSFNEIPHLADAPHLHTLV